MPRLILLNGPPASGKSTLARRYGVDHPLALALDIDVVRSLLGGWLDDPEAAGVAARAMALAMAREHLRAGRDVVVPQFLARPQLPEQLELLARDVDAEFAEVVVDLDPDQMLTRFVRRTAEAGRGEHRDAAELLGRGGGTPQLLTMRAQMLSMVAQRPRARFLASRDGDLEGTYRSLLDIVGAASARPRSMD